MPCSLLELDKSQAESGPIGIQMSSIAAEVRAEASCLGKIRGVIML